MAPAGKTSRLISYLIYGDSLIESWYVQITQANEAKIPCASRKSSMRAISTPDIVANLKAVWEQQKYRNHLEWSV